MEEAHQAHHRMQEEGAEAVAGDLPGEPSAVQDDT